ncbi:ankyrin repeat domain-containing protein [Sphingobacterium faecium]|uniref:ankyrin repeat domain-containing protein n=1 Tax=Sphingobacterium faecium TaxID=34087 RepID=UPI002468A0A0|nr:ankyrin repeat domain-containing protein [Sphingobacterium faecium]MDH5825394.1 ankyrin repeat domain-containing protein [Sphingobacterium faecium]
MKKVILFLICLIYMSQLNAQDIFLASRTDNVAMMDSLFQADATLDLDAVDEKGFSALILAVYNNSEHVTPYLLSKGAAVDFQDKHGNTALMGATFKGNLPMVKLLVENQADINKKNSNGATALIYAATFGQKDIGAFLLENGAVKSFKDNRGNTAFDHAIMQEHIELIKLLK